MSQDPQELLVDLARPMRHEVNNLLAALSGTAELVMRAAAADPRAAARVARLQAATARMQALLHAYLALGAPPPEDTPAADVLEAMGPLIALVMGPGRLTEVAASPGLPRLASHPGALQAAAVRLALAAARSARPDARLRMSLQAAPGGALLAIHAEPVGATPPPVFLPAAPS